MNTTRRDGGCWPTKQQELLLRAALLKGNETIDAWHEWKSNVDVHSLDQASRQLLPLLYRNLSIHGVEDPLMDMFKGIYRLTWYKNQMLLHDMADVLSAFHNAEIKTMILKGAALTLIHYKDYGLRYMEDFDVLVETEQASAAIELLKRLGWRPISRPMKAFNKEYFSVRHSHGFEDDVRRQFDLHWHVFFESCYANSDKDFWTVAVSTEFHNFSTYALNPTDQLLHVFAHGINWAPVPLLRWIADAIMIINTSQSGIDWNRFIAQAQKHRLILPIKDALKYLHEVFNVSIPSAVFKKLQDMHVSRIECMEYRVNTSPPGLMGGIPNTWFRYLRFSQTASTPLSHLNFIGFIRFLQHTWGMDHLWQVPLHIISSGISRAWKMVAANPDYS
jgi:hypothetical protein